MTFSVESPWYYADDNDDEDMGLVFSLFLTLGETEGLEEINIKFIFFVSSSSCIQRDNAMGGRRSIYPLQLGNGIGRPCGEHNKGWLFILESKFIWSHFTSGQKIDGKYLPKKGETDGTRRNLSVPLGSFLRLTEYKWPTEKCRIPSF